MADTPRIPVDEARRKVTTGRAPLVCAYDEEAKCSKISLQGARSLAQLEPKLSALPKDQEIMPQLHFGRGARNL